MNNSIKREQSQAGLSFAERENQRSAAGGKANFRPQVKRKLLSLLVLLLTAVTGAWAQTYDNTVNINTHEGDVVVPEGKHWLITGTGVGTTNTITIGPNATVTLSGVNINSSSNSCIQCEIYSNATIILADGTTNTLTSTGKWCAAIQVGCGTNDHESKLTIQGSGSLNATGGTYGAGIGSNGSTTCGNIVILGGDITATGSQYGAGIGAGNYGSCGNITISGGTVDAKGGQYAAGIGATVIGHCGNITISGGTVYAKGGEGAAGIGGGQPDTNANGYCGNITISGGTVDAKGGLYGAGIGAGNIGQCNNITINGGTVYAKAGSNAAGIGGGQGQTSTNNGNCGNITINGGLVSVTDKGAVCIGSGQYSTCGAITITDGSFRLTNSNNHTHDFIGGNCGTVTIDGVKNADENSTFTHFKSDFISTSTVWILTRDLYDVTANLADGAYWSTFYSESGNYQAPEGTQVFAVNLNGKEITMTEIPDRIAKKGEGVVLRQATESVAATTTIEMTLSLEATGNFSTNSLKGTTISIPNPGNAYVLGYKEDAGVGFYKLSGVTIGANKAYLTYDGPVPARGFFGFDDATGIEMPTVESNDDADAVVYDLQGRRVSQPAKGLYIVKGKKVIIK